MPQHRRGAPLKVKLDLAQSEAAECQASERLDAWEWLF